MAYEKPNYTQTPNRFFDEHLKDISKMSELKVTLAVLRQTFGYHEKQARLTIPELMAHTGLSRPSVVEGLTAAVERGTLQRRRDGHTFTYEPNMGTVKNVNSLTVKNFDQKVNSSEGVSLVPERKKENTSPPGYKAPRKSKEERTRYPPEKFVVTDWMDVHLQERGIYLTEEQKVDFVDRWREAKIADADKSRNLYEWQHSFLRYVRTWFEKRSSNGNGYKRVEEESGGEYPSFMAPPKPVDYFEKKNAEFRGK